jgi:hypothetical protein
MKKVVDQLKSKTAYIASGKLLDISLAFLFIFSNYFLLKAVKAVRKLDSVMSPKVNCLQEIALNIL